MEFFVSLVYFIISSFLCCSQQCTDQICFVIIDQHFSVIFPDPQAQVVLLTLDKNLQNKALITDIPAYDQKVSFLVDYCF